MGALTWMSNWYGVSGTPSSQTFLRGDGTFAQVSSASIGTNYTDSVSSGTGINVTGTPGAPWTPVVALTPLTLSATYFSSLSAANLTAVPAAQLSGTITSATQDNITRVGTLVAGATGAGFTIALSASTITGTLAAARGGTALDTSGSSGLPSINSGAWAVNNVLTAGRVLYGAAGNTVTSSANLYFDGTNLGIGTAGPGYLLDLLTTSATNKGMRITTGGEVHSGLWNTNANASSRNWDIATNYSAWGAFEIRYSTARLGDPISAGAAALTILNTGNVGIGIASPSNKLHVQGTAAGSAGIYLNDAIPSATSYTLYNNAGTLTWNGVALATGSSVTGTTGTICKFTAANSVGDSIITESGGQITVGGDLIL